MALLEIRSPVHKKETRAPGGTQVEVRWQVQIVDRVEGKEDRIVAELPAETDCNAPPEAIALFDAAVESDAVKAERRALKEERKAAARAEKAEAENEALSKDNAALKGEVSRLSQKASRREEEEASA